MDFNLIGCVAEYKFAVKAMELGLFVSFPLLDASTYDCIVDTGNSLKKIQIKSVASNSENSRCFLRSVKKNPYSLNDVDYFAIYLKYHDGFYIFKNDGIIKTIRFNKKTILSNNFNNFEFL
jgi:hypothetical protein